MHKAEQSAFYKGEKNAGRYYTETFRTIKYQD